VVLLRADADGDAEDSGVDGWPPFDASYTVALDEQAKEIVN